ncbi:MAG: PIN domain-containing protein [Cyanobacteria bacterium J06638_20]
MSDLFIDTSGWANFFIATQPNHTEAVQILTRVVQEKQTLTTSNYIIAELVALLQSPIRVPRSRIFNVIDTVKATPYIDIIHIDAETDMVAWSLCKSRPDKNWSLVDCTSFALMQKHNIQTALTTDRHFEQAGFVRLLNPSNS